VQKSGLHLSNIPHGEVTVVTVGGFLDGHTIVNLEQHVAALIKTDCKRLVFELSTLTYIASAGVGLFIATSHRLKGLGGSLQLVTPSPSVAEIFAILGLEAIFTIHAGLDTAISAAKA
jgi:anti-sigma B factor antagonist